jgi:hypothetical protein
MSAFIILPKYFVRFSEDFRFPKLSFSYATLRLRTEVKSTG